MTIQFVFTTIPQTRAMNTSSRMQMILNEWELIGMDRNG